MKLRNLFTLLAALFILTSCSPAPDLKVRPKSDKEKNHLKGNVATITIQKQSIFSDGTDKNSFRYNSDGNIIESIAYFKDTVYQTLNYSYNKNFLISKVTTTNSSNTFEVTYEYDDHGFRTKTINGHVNLSHKNTMENGKIKSIATYNTVLDQLAEQEVYNYFPDYTEKVVRVYDNGNRFTTNIYKYNLKNDLIEQLSDDQSEHHFQYNDKSELIKEEVKYPGKSAESGDSVTVDKIYSAVDQQGNWTKMTEKENGKVTGTVTRTILYEK